MKNNKKPLTNREYQTVKEMARKDQQKGKTNTPVTFLDEIMSIFDGKKAKRNKAIKNTYANQQKRTQERQAENERIKELKRKNK